MAWRSFLLSDALDWPSDGNNQSGGLWPSNNSNPTWPGTTIIVTLPDSSADLLFCLGERSWFQTSVHEFNGSKSVYKADISSYKVLSWQ
uniref:Uncharacterized protein n=1 Tax=Nothobranchius furzeri TaxID=105023 RepID=A0A1A7ZSJ7_NOTFU